MKAALVFVAFLSVVSAFAPQPVGRANTDLQASLFDTIFGMDLFAPNPTVNTYGSRSKKNLKVGTITDKSYVPNGLTADQYKKVRAQEQQKKDANYARNVNKAFKFQDYTEFYMKRGTSEGGSWLKSAGKGHTFAKTKFDWTGKKAEAKLFESASASSIFKQK